MIRYDAKVNVECVLQSDQARGAYDAPLLSAWEGTSLPDLNRLRRLCARYVHRNGIPDGNWKRESHGNGNKIRNWECEWQGMGNHLNGNGNYLHSQGNLFPQVLCCDKLNNISVGTLTTCQMPIAFCAEFADYLNLIINDQGFCY